MLMKLTLYIFTQLLGGLTSACSLVAYAKRALQNETVILLTDTRLKLYNINSVHLYLSVS